MQGLKMVIRECKTCKSYDYCVYRTYFNTDERVGCIYYIDENEPDLKVSNRIEEEDIIEKTVDNKCR